MFLRVHVCSNVMKCLCMLVGGCAHVGAGMHPCMYFCTYTYVYVWYERKLVRMYTYVYDCVRMVCLYKITLLNECMKQDVNA